MIGFGHAVVHVAGYLFPGGEDDIVGYITAYLGTPVTPGDPASIVLRVELLGVERIKEAIQQNTGYTIRTVTTVTGRIVNRPAGTYGLRVVFDGLPGGFQAPSPVSVQVTRVKLQLGAVLLKRVKFVRRYAVPGLAGSHVLRVHDHRLVAYNLLTNPPACHGSWPFQLRLGFPSQTTTYTARVRCTRGRVPLAPPPSPSALERA
jgi:hypothetical protein